MQQFLASLGPVTSVIGAQWGDEGKGKVVDMLAEHYDVIARSAGGANAGHTIIVDGKKHVFHLLPSGCLHEEKPVVLGAGMVLHLPTLLEEIDMLKDAGIDITPRLHISPEAHILFEYHKDIDGAMEDQRSQAKGQGIGTTRRGIGPAYMDKAARVGIRMERLGDDLTAELKHIAERVQQSYNVQIDIKTEMENIKIAHDRLGSRVVDTITFLHQSLNDKKTLLIEGAQATLLDIDHGTYPYVTSSATTITGALQGLGLPPRVLTSCIGVAKAYCTRVGSGTFLTEAKGEAGDRLRERGGEYGATTGRPRRCGWLDISDLKFAAMINGYTHWNITKLDVLDEEETIPVGVSKNELGLPIFQELPGWKSSTKGMTSFDQLPEKAQQYIEFIEQQTDIPVALIGTGQGREEMIVR